MTNHLQTNSGSPKENHYKVHSSALLMRESEMLRKSARALRDEAEKIREISRTFRQELASK